MRTGRCQCGAVQFECPGKPDALYVCHCRDCRRQSSSAFGISYLTDWNELRVTQGEPRYWARPTGSGGTLNCAFCPSCGSRLWHRPDNDGAVVSVKAGSLDEPVDLTTAVHIWVQSRLPGLAIPDGATVFPGEPE